MGKRETDTSASETATETSASETTTETSASETATDTSTSETATDAVASDATASDAKTDTDRKPEALFEALVEESVLAVEAGEAATDGGEDVTVRTTDAFDDTHAVYHDSYVGVSETEFHEAVAATFGLPDSDSAAELVAERGVTREEFICYLAVRSHLDRDADPDDLAAMAGMVSEVVPDSPVPSAVADVTDDPVGFLAGRDRAVVSVWKRFCDPCESLKADLDSILDAVPDDVTVAGIDGEVATEFCETHEIESAPGFVVLRSDSDPRTVTGNDPAAVAEALRSAYAD